MTYGYRLEGKKVKLKDYPTAKDGGLKREEALHEFHQLNAELQSLQELLYGAADHSVLLVLQGRDTAGKDGTVKSVLDNINPMGCRIAAFKSPTLDELAHDFLWRVHREVPARGQIGIFNRSHYEDVLISRVRAFVPDTVWRQRYRQINDFERLLVESGTILVKCYLHISAEEQEKRLHERERDPSKSWKLSVGDWQDRDFWDDYTEAYEDMLEKCAGEDAPWWLIPADKKWFRNLAVAEVLVKALRPFREGWSETLRKRGETARAAIDEFRRARKRDD